MPLILFAHTLKNVFWTNWDIFPKYLFNNFLAKFGFVSGLIFSWCIYLDIGTDFLVLVEFLIVRTMFHTFPLLPKCGTLYGLIVKGIKINSCSSNKDFGPERLDMKHFW